jgi:hypothetical protein
MTKAHNERCRGCKDAIRSLLEAVFGIVEVNFDLNLPSALLDYAGRDTFFTLDRVYKALQEHRGFNNSVRSKKLPRVDFFIPNRSLIIEFDESQHFTEPRDISLSLYLKKEKFGFSPTRWRALCQTLHKRDNDPPFRDEQRAWYDTLRDFAPKYRGAGQIVRLYSRERVWCSIDPCKAPDFRLFKRLIFEKIEGAQ